MFVLHSVFCLQGYHTKLRSCTWCSTLYNIYQAIESSKGYIEQIFQARQVPKMGLSSLTSNPDPRLQLASLSLWHSCIWKGVWADPPCLFLQRSRLSGACLNCDLKFWVRACLAIQTTHGSEIPDTSGCLSCLNIYQVLPHKILWETNLKKAPDLSALHVFSSQNSQTWSKHNTVWQNICPLQQTWPSLLLVMNPESSGASASSRLGLLSCWVQNSLSQLGLIATDAILCAVGHKVEIVFHSLILRADEHERSPILPESRGFGWESHGICRGNSGEAGFAQGPSAFLVQRCWRQCTVPRSALDPH